MILSPAARSLLGIQPDERLPDSLEMLYDCHFARKSYRTRFANGWSFLPRGNRVEDGLDLCLDHLTAQFDFGIDPDFRVYVLCEGPVQIASSVLSLVEKDAILLGSPATGKSRRGFGQFTSFDAFMTKHGDYVKGWTEAPFTDHDFSRFYIGPASVVVLGRFYSDEPLICGIEYF